MILSYYDEAGDDGYPDTSSQLFVLTCIYFHYLNWQPIYQKIYALRQFLKGTYNFPVRMELHKREFLLNKKPYSALRMPDSQRIEIMDACCSCIASLDLKSISATIIKPNIKKPDYDVLDNAFTYSIQRIENDLNTLDPSSKFMIITDPGRVGKMRKTARRIRKINFIPSKYSTSTYRKEIQRLIEDPLQKESDESYFIQFCDMISYIIYEHKILELGIGALPRRMPLLIDQAKFTEWMERLKPIFNLKASASDPYGIVCYPKK